MKLTDKKVLTTLALGAAAATTGAAIAACITKMLVRTALDREQPKFIEKSGIGISGAPDNEEFELVCGEAAQNLRDTEHEYVKIVNSEGIELVGHFFPCDNAKRVIIAFHGWRSSWCKDFGLIADFWHNSGSSVLYVEQRAQNNSGGDYIGFGLTERHDCIDWINWTMCRCGKNIPIYLAGVSMGATTVLMASGSPLPPNVHGIMADCGFTSPKEIWKHVANKNLHIAYGFRSVLADSMCKKKLNVRSGDYSTLEALSATDVPVLFVHGTDDHFVPIEMTYKNYEACASPKRLLVVPGAEHAMSYYVDRRAYEKAVLDFWKDFD